MVKRKIVVQHHHISYNPEVIVPVHRGEHWIICQLNRRKHVSKGLLTTLEVYIALHRNTAEELK